MNRAHNIERLGLGAALLLTTAFLLTGCDKNDYTLAFSHNLHVKDNGMACEDCHGKATNGYYALPGHAACTDCHTDWIETKTIGEKTCGMCHKQKGLQRLAEAQTAATAGTARAAKHGDVFVHTSALSNRCQDCHANLLDEKLKSTPAMTRHARLQIRQKAHAWGMACGACHVDMDPQIAPPSHHENWTRRHGAFGIQPDNACKVCHTEQTCRECHQVTKPQSHNNLWRLKTHGIQADWDRQRCLVCHEEDSCQACHSETKPQSHVASWDKTHCQQCHFSTATGSGCTVCHGPDLIANHPNPHPAGWRSQHCNTCHPGSPQTEQCKICHGADLIGNHPNPHSAGWRDRHCFSCHPGSRQNCALCHEGGNSVLVHEDFWPPVHNLFGDQANCYDCHIP